MTALLRLNLKARGLDVFENLEIAEEEECVVRTVRKKKVLCQKYVSSFVICMSEEFHVRSMSPGGGREHVGRALIEP